MSAFHERLAQVALRAASSLGFALCRRLRRSGARLSDPPERGHRPVTSAERTDFGDGVTAIKSAYEQNGTAVRVDVCSDHFARSWVTDTASGQSGKVELAADIRSKAPVTMNIGPVVHVDDVAAARWRRCSPALRHGNYASLIRPAGKTTQPAANRGQAAVAAGHSESSPVSRE